MFEFSGDGTQEEIEVKNPGYKFLLDLGKISSSPWEEEEDLEKFI